jgi:hypothetical protein
MCDAIEFSWFVEREGLPEPWHAAFRSSVERITVVIGPSSDGREKDQRGNGWSRARELGALSDSGLWHLHCVVKLLGVLGGVYETDSDSGACVVE